MLRRCYPLEDPRISESEVFVHRLVGETHLLRATIEQQAAWLREITTERDALKLRVTELEEAERLRDEALVGKISLPTAEQLEREGYRW